jgi:S-formylglutathione hydrolase FrmB
MSTDRVVSRRSLLKATGGAAALTALGVTWKPGRAEAAVDGFGLHIVDQGVFDRMNYYRFQTSNISWNPAVNVLLPDDYFSTTSRRYPVMYLLHGGAQDFRKFDFEDDIRGLTAGRRLIVVMPDGGTAGWYCNPVSSYAGPRNYESFHIGQLVPWIDANFRTWAEYNGRAVSGFSMGGFGALKYTAKYYGHFASVSSHSGPASLRRDSGAVVHWANTSSQWAELNGGTMYGSPFWDQGRVTADNPVERLESYRNKRIFLVTGLDNDTNENFVRPGQREFRGLLAARGIPHEWYELPGGHFVRRDMLQRDIDGVVARLRPAG